MSAGVPTTFADWHPSEDGEASAITLLHGAGKPSNAGSPAVCGYCRSSCPVQDRVSEDDHLVHTLLSDSGILRVQEVVRSSATSAARLVSPLLRNASGQLKAVEWPQALREFVARMQGLQKDHGEDSIAILAPGRLTLEETAFLGALTRSGMGTNATASVPSSWTSSAAVREQAFGFDAPSLSHSDFEEADAVVLIGVNLSVTHAPLWDRVARNPHRPRVVVIDPRRTETSALADLHLQIQPSSEAILLHTIARELVERDWVDSDYVKRCTSGFSALAAYIERFTVDIAARETRLSVGLIEHLAELIHKSERVVFVWSNETGSGDESDTARAAVNLALMTGNIGRPGCGVYSVNEPCGESGMRLVDIRNSLWGARDFSSAADRALASDVTGIPLKSLPTSPAQSWEQILLGVESGSIHGLWIVGTGSSADWSQSPRVQNALRLLDFLVVQDTHDQTPGLEFANLVLPAAELGEKKGTFITAERRLKFVSHTAPAPGNSLTDFAIFRLIAEAWGCGRLLRRWTSPETVFRMLKCLVAGQPCDFSGVADHAALADSLGIQWPYAGGAGDPAYERRLFEDGRFYHPDGRARFTFEDPRRTLERQDHTSDLCLRIGSEAGFRKDDTLSSEFACGSRRILMNAADCSRLGLIENDRARVVFDAVSLTGFVSLSMAVPIGEVHVFEERRRRGLASSFHPSRMHGFEAAERRCSVTRELSAMREPAA